MRQQEALFIFALVILGILRACPAPLIPEPAGPEAAFSASPREGIAPLTVRFTDESAHGDATIHAWHWQFGDGNASSSRQPIHRYTQPGVYNVTLTVTTVLGSDQVTRQGFIVVAPGSGAP